MKKRSGRIDESLKACTLEISYLCGQRVHIGEIEFRRPQAGFFHAGTNQRGAAEIGVIELGRMELRPIERGTPQIEAGKVQAGQILIR